MGSPCGSTAEMSEEVDEVAVGSSGYHYWHDTVSKGENAAPMPEHKAIAVEKEATPVEDKAVTIDNFAFLDDDDVVKVYIKLEGDLASVTTEAVEFKVERERYEP